LAASLPYYGCKGENAVLRISIVDKPKQLRLVLEGMLVTPWAAELKKACDKARAERNGRELLVELKNLVAISEDGENVLLGLMNDGVKLCSQDIFTKGMLRQIARRIRRSPQEKKR
jgi:anti-anti-sigma regulatory factor